jgi:hypothetical protein
MHELLRQNGPNPQCVRCVRRYQVQSNLKENMKTTDQLHPKKSASVSTPRLNFLNNLKHMMKTKTDKTDPAPPDLEQSSEPDEETIKQINRALQTIGATATSIQPNPIEGPTP